MSPLQQRMLEDMQLRGLSARTQEAYARAVWQLAQYYHRRPDQLSEDGRRGLRRRQRVVGWEEPGLLNA
jgi:integrase/recombinase XerD